MSSGIPRPKTAPSLLTSNCRPHDSDPSLTTAELVQKLLALLHLFVFHLFPALLFGILGLIFDDAARLFNAAASFFRKESLPPASSSNHHWDVKQVLRPSVTSRRSTTENPSVRLLPGVPIVDSKNGQPEDTSFACVVTGPASEPVTLSKAKLKKLFTESEGDKETSTTGASTVRERVEKALSALSLAKTELDPSFSATVRTNHANSKVGPSKQPHVQPIVDHQSMPVSPALHESVSSVTTAPTADPFELSPPQALANIDFESPEGEASHAVSKHEVSDELIEPEPAKPSLSVPSNIPGVRFDSGPTEDSIFSRAVQPIDEPFASPDPASLCWPSVEKRSPSPQTYDVAAGQSLHKRSEIASAASNFSSTVECSSPPAVSAADAIYLGISDVANADLELQPVSTCLSSVEQDRLRTEGDFDGSENEVSSGEPIILDESVQKVTRSNAQNFVAAKVHEYERFLMPGESKLEVARELPSPTPLAPIKSEVQGLDTDSDQEDSREVLISQLKSTLSSAVDIDNTSMVKSVEEAALSESLRGFGNANNGEGADERTFAGREAGEGLGRSSSKAIDILDGVLPDTEFDEDIIGPRDAFFIEENQSSTEAPAGVESLQELIPEIIPDVTVDRVPQPSEQELLETEVPTSPKINGSISEGTLPDAAIVSVTSMEGLDKLPSLTLQRLKSDASFKTESYSSPNSPMHSSSTESTSQGRHRDSWRASDHDLFSEDPMMDMEGSSLPASRQLSRRVSCSNFDPAVLEDFDSTAMVSTPALQSRKRASTNSSENEIGTSTPVTSSGGRDSAQSRMEDLGSEHSWHHCAKSSKCSEDTAERVAYRQASVDVTSRGTPSISRDRRVLKDRARSKFPRLGPSNMTGRPAVASRLGRPMADSKMGRSVSTSETRFEDWPEYRPSRDEVPGRLSRRHQSDMSFGSKTRKDVLLPEETSEDNGPTEAGHTLAEDDMPQRLGGSRRGWKFGFGRTAGSKEGGDVKGVMKNILWRRRKASNVDECTSQHGAVSKTDSHHRASIDKAPRRSIGMEAEFSFEIELPQDSAYALLGRICPDCGYRVVVTRPLYKMKIEIPLSGGAMWLLASITLAKVWHGRGTHLSISRSKEDVSGGADGEIESAGLLLRTRLEAHVEFLEDSFASLKLDGSSQDIAES